MCACVWVWVRVCVWCVFDCVCVGACVDLCVCGCIWRVVCRCVYVYVGACV